jgi:hypothetical protein
MVWVLGGIAVLVAAAAAGCLWYRWRLGQETALMTATATSRAADVATLAPGTMAEVKGTLRCDSPITAEFSNLPCVYYKAEIKRETAYYERDSQGNRQRRRRTETLSSNIRHAPCMVEDASGAVKLNLEDADVEGEQVVNRREREVSSVASTVINIALGGSDSAELIYTESILQKDIPVYVLGEVQADRSISRPAPNSKNRIFTVSRKSEEERLKDLGSTRLWLLVGAIVLLIAAAALAYFAIGA